MSDWETSFASWASPPSETEQEKCAHAETAIRKAIEADSALKQHKVSVFAQGSYRARTNVRLDSDVDICVRLNEVWYGDYPAGRTKSDYGFVDATISYTAFKQMVQNALTSYFGSNFVTRGNKAFDIHSNTYRIDADAIATLEYRRYYGNGVNDYTPGVAFWPDGGSTYVANFPQQNYDNGVSKNDRTSKNYKSVVRILKRLRNKMQDDRIDAAKNIASFLLECLAYNAPDSTFVGTTWKDIMRNLLTNTYEPTSKDELCANWVEVNERKRLFWPSQPWTRGQLNAFIVASWRYLDFK